MSRVRHGWTMAVFAALTVVLIQPAHAEPTGHQLFLGPAFSGTPPVEVPFAPASITSQGATVLVTVYLHRADDAGPAQPPAMSFDLVWDPAVLSVTPGPGAVTATPLMLNWYDKQVTTNFTQAANGILSISVSGGVTFDPDTFEAFSTEITTYDNQLPVIAPETGTARQNPFPILTVRFSVAGGGGAATPLSFQGAVLSDQDGFAIPNQGALDTVLEIAGDDFPPVPPGTPLGGSAALFLVAGAMLALGRRTARRA